MICNLGSFLAFLDKGFHSFQNEITRRAWKNEKQHNYKQIVYYKDINGKLFAIKNENDFKIYVKNRVINSDVEMVFIPKKHFTSIDEAIKHAAPYHNISCNGCGIQPIIGTAYKCLECPSFHLCEICEEDEHHSQHMMLVVNTSEIIAKSPTAEPHAAHAHCHNCGVDPIIGFFYKCIVCTNRFFCINCTKKLLPCKNHGMIRFPDNGGAAGTVVSEANVQSVEDRQFKNLNNKMDKMITLMESKVLNIDGNSASKASEKSHQQEDNTDESKDRSVYKAD